MAATATSGKSKTAGKAAVQAKPAHTGAAHQHNNGPAVQRKDAKAPVQPAAKKDTIVQAKITMGQPGDRFEAEADATADKVMKMNAAEVAKRARPRGVQPKPLVQSKPLVQAKAMPGGFLFKKAEEKKLQKAAEKQKEPEKQKLQKKEEPKLQKAAEKQKEPEKQKLQKKEEPKLQKAAEKQKEPEKQKLQKKEEPKLQKAAEKLKQPEKLKVQKKEEKKEVKKKEEKKQLQKKAEPLALLSAKEAPGIRLKPTLQLQVAKPATVARVVQAAPQPAKEEKKLQKKEQPKLQKAPQEKLQKQAVQLKVVTPTIQPKKEEEKIQKKAEEQKVQKKVEEQKVQKAPEKKIQQQTIQLKVATPVVRTKKEEEKVQKKTDEPKIQKALAEPIAKPAVQLKAATPVVSGTVQTSKEQEKLQKKNTPAQAPPVKQPDKKPGNEVDPKIESRLNNAMSGGEALPANVREFMEPRFGVDFSTVRIHTDPEAQKLAQDLGAKAFAFGNHIFFGKGQYNPGSAAGRWLLAHELTHVVQQGHAEEPETETEQAKAAKSEKPKTSTSPEQVQRAAEEKKVQKATDEKKIQKAADEKKVQKAADEKKIQKQVAGVSSAPRSIQRLGLSDILDGLAALAANIPGFTLLTVIIGMNPINMQSVDRSPLNILRGFIGLIPGGEILFQVLNRYGVAQRIADWVAAQVAAFGITFSALHDAFTRFTDSLSWTDIFSPGDVWNRAKDIFTPFITRIVNFAAALIAQAIAWLKETFMQPLSDFCRQIPGYGLVTVLLGRDPFTNQAVPRTAMNVVKAFAEFIPGGTEKVQQLEESKGLQKAYDWFIQETTARNLTWDRISGTFTSAWNSLKLEDVLSPIETLQRIGTMFSPLFTDLVGFAGAALMKLLEFIYEAVMGAGGARVLAIIKKSSATFKTVIQNPVGFLGNLVTAVGMGIRQFAGNILKHLQTGVITWLTGTLTKAGVQLPEKWDLTGIVKFILALLGLTYPRIRGIAVEVFTERVVGALETVAGLVMDIKEKGFVQTIKDRISEFFSGLKEMILGKIKSFIQERIVMAGIQQLVSLLSPVGAVIQAIIKTYQTVMFFIQKINQILDFVESIVNSIAAIAAGSLGPAANYVEQTMARTIPLILDFLARMIGLGDVSGKIKSLIEQAQEFIAGKVRQAMMWIKTTVMKLFQMGKDAAGKLVDWWKEKKQFTNKAGESHTLSFKGTKENAKLYISTTTMPIADYLKQKREQNKDKPDVLAKIGVAEGIISAKNSVVFTSGNATPDEKKKRDDVIAALAAISQSLMDIGGADFKDPDDYPAPTVAAGEAQNLSKAKLPAGQSTTGIDHGTRNWAYIVANKLTKGTGDDWVQMHLISEKLGGKAEGPNLVAAPNGVNSAWRSGIETGGVALVNKPAEGQGKPASVMWMKTTVNYSIVIDGQTFASSVSTKAGLYAYKGKKDNKADFEKVDTAVFSQTAQIPSPEAAMKKVAILNTSSGTQMERYGGISLADLRNEIKRNRPYSTKAHFYSKMIAVMDVRYPDATNGTRVSFLAAAAAARDNAKVVANDTDA